MCNDGPACTRHVCFFAHSMEEMRSAPGKKDAQATVSLRSKTEAASEFARPLSGQSTKFGLLVQGSPDTPFICASSGLATGSSASDPCSPHVLAASTTAPGTDSDQAQVTTLCGSLSPYIPQLCPQSAVADIDGDELKNFLLGKGQSLESLRLCSACGSCQAMLYSWS